MKVDKIITPIVRDTVENGIKKAEKVVEKPIEEFTGKAGDVAGRTKVLLDSKKEITFEELRVIKEELRRKMVDRNFSQKNIDYILSFTNKDTWRVAKELIEDEYAHTSEITWTIGYTTKENAALMEYAAKMKNYDAMVNIHQACYGRPKINNISEIKDMRKEVMRTREVYRPKKRTMPVISEDVLYTQKQEVLNRLKQTGADEKTLDYIKGHLNIENIEVARLLAEDTNAKDNMLRDHLEFIQWVVPYTNAENADLMIRAILNKDYTAVYSIEGGLTRSLDTLDARYAFWKRRDKELDKNSPDYYEKINKVTKFINDKFSDFMKVLMEDEAIDFNFIVEIAEHLNKENKNALKKAFIERDFATIEEICGERLFSKSLDPTKEKLKFEFKTTSSNGKITRNDFIRYMDDKLTHTENFDVATLKDSEVRNLAKLLGTTEEQIRNMDKREYRRLCIKTHPDRNPNDNLANQVFRILNRIYQG